MENNIYTITQEELEKYSNCPIRYDIIHNKKFNIGKNPSVNELLHTVFKAFCSGLMNGKVMTTGQIKSKWDRQCEMNKDIISPQKAIEGLGQLMKMYRWAEREELKVLDMNVPYSVIVPGRNDTRIDIRGHIDLVAAHKNEPCILFADFSNRYPDQMILDMRLKYTLQSYAFTQVYGKWAGIKIHNIKNDKDFYTTRKKDDYDRLLKSVENIAFSIENQIYYPRETAFCRNCELMAFCRAWR